MEIEIELPESTDTNELAEAVEELSETVETVVEELTETVEEVVEELAEVVEAAADDTPTNVPATAEQMQALAERIDELTLKVVDNNTATEEVLEEVLEEVDTPSDIPVVIDVPPLTRKERWLQKWFQ